MRTLIFDRGPARRRLIGLFAVGFSLAAGSASAQINLVKPTVVKPSTAVTQTSTVQLITPTTPAKPVTPTAPATPASPTTTWGTAANMFAANSPWNSRPVAPVLGTFVIPTSSYFPSISDGAWSTGIFKAASTDGPVTIYGITDAAGISDTDAGFNRASITLPHWPGTIIPASGADGHADVLDETSGVLYSFWQLQYTGGKWRAQMYAWSPLAGRGFGDPAHFYQGARATGVPTSAGIIRQAEVNDGNPTYKHALAMSLTYNAMSGGLNADLPAFVYPATSADWDANANTGDPVSAAGKPLSARAIPEGALLMLPPSYDSSKIANAQLRKVVDTLKTYGAYVVDRNVGTPFTIYVENKVGLNTTTNTLTGLPSAFNLMPTGWDNTIAAQLDDIRANLRRVMSASSWVDGNNQTYVPQTLFNNLSMRGAWNLDSPGATPGVFNSLNQSLDFPASTARVWQETVGGPSSVYWARPAVGSTQLLSVKATNGATANFTVYSGGTWMFRTSDLGDGQTQRFTMPANFWMVMQVGSGGGGKASSITAQMNTVTP